MIPILDFRDVCLFVYWVAWFVYVFVCVFVGDGILNYTVWVGKRVFFIIQRFLTLVFSVWGGAG